MTAGPFPRITVVTPSLNQAAFLERTIASVAAQDYPAVEHIVVDGMSTDATPEILARHPHLRVLREKDRNQADALNKGFAGATGDILCVLNSDDTFAPGALRRVAAEIAPERGRHVVLGRCRFIDEDDGFLGIEHPSGFVDHGRVLEIWKGHMLPQPAIFWTREVWERCGPFDEAAGPFLDYELFIRMSRVYSFHPVDQVLAHYRLHAGAQTAAMTDAERLERAIRVSRRHWGSPARALYWRLFGSWLAHRVDRRRRAVRLMRGGREELRRGRPLAAALRGSAGALLAPDVLIDVAGLPALRRLARGLLPPRLLAAVTPTPQTLAFRDFDGIHADGWAGPVMRVPIEVPEGRAVARLAGSPWSPDFQPGLVLTFFVDGRLVARHEPVPGAAFAVAVPLPGLPPGRHELRIEASAWVVPDRYLGNRDHRPLAFRVDELAVEALAPVESPPPEG